MTTQGKVFNQKYINSEDAVFGCFNEKPVIENYEQDIGNKVKNCGIYKDMENTLRESNCSISLHWTLFT